MADKMKPAEAVETEANVKKERVRSPNYPVVSLQKAVERAKTLYDAYKGAEIPIAVVHQKWGYKPFTVNAVQLAAALKAYGLIAVKGAGEKQFIKLSDRAQKILGNHPDREKLLQEAALSPTIYKEIWEKYQPEGLPTDEALSTYLRWERKFNPNYISRLIADFRNTIDFAQITATISGGGKKTNPEASPDVGGSKPPENGKISPPTGAALLPDRCDMATDTFTLDEGPVVLQYPKTLSSSSFEDFKSWTELQLRKIQRSIKNDVPPVGTVEEEKKSE
jgi:hypothetical protein